MTEEQVGQQEPQAPPLPSYAKLGLKRSFPGLVDERQGYSADLSALTKKKSAATEAIKQALTEQVLGMEVDPKDEESFKVLVADVAAGGGAACTTKNWTVKIVPGEKKTIDEGVLIRELLNEGLTLKRAGEIVAAATKTSRWGEISIEAIPQKAASAAKPLVKPKRREKSTAPKTPVPTRTTPKRKVASTGRRK